MVFISKKRHFPLSHVGECVVESLSAGAAVSRVYSGY